MCFAPVTDPQEEPPTPVAEPVIRSDHEPADRATSAATSTSTVGRKAAVWPCQVCGSKNAIELDICATCGTPFATLMREERAGPKIEPSDAFRRSLVYPGLGHRMVGRAIDGFARGVLFGMLLLATLMLGLSGVSTGAVRFLFLTYAVGTISVYLMTALEARRLAEGGDLLVSSRALLWATVGILLLSIVMVALVIGSAARR
jgi:hypothetical protein